MKKNQFLYTIQPTRLEMLTEGSTEEEVAIISRHAAYLQDLTERGVAVLVGRTTNTDESTFGIIVFQATSEEEARSIIENDPAVIGGVMKAVLYPFRIVFTNLESL